jgi:hypothetical protein
MRKHDRDQICYPNQAGNRQQASCGNHKHPSKIILGRKDKKVNKKTSEPFGSEVNLLENYFFRLSSTATLTVMPTMPGKRIIS